MHDTLNQSEENHQSQTLSRLLVAGMAAMMLALLPARSAVAVGPYSPSADTYTDQNNPDTNNGNDELLLLSATNTAEGGCVETTYLWFKFDIPSTGTTIDNASLELVFESTGSGTTDLELRSSADTSWSETGLTWNNQPALEDDVLSTATGVTPGSTATFSDAPLATYLNARQGQTVSLVVRADCGGSVSTSASLELRSQEHTSGSGASLSLYGPTAVTLVSLTARSAHSSPSLPPIVIAVGGILALFVLGAGGISWLHTRAGSQEHFIRPSLRENSQKEKKCGS